MRRVAILTWFWLTATLLCAQPFGQYKAVLSDVLVQPGEFMPLPLAGTSFWCDSVPETMRQSYVKYGEQYLGKQWSSLPVSIFAQSRRMATVSPTSSYALRSGASWLRWLWPK